MASARRGILLFALLAASAQSSTAHAQSDRQVTRIVMLYGHDPNTPGATAFARELQGVVAREWPEHVEVYDEVLDFDRFGRSNWPHFAAYLATRYRGVKVDAVVAEGSMALQFAVEQFGAVLPGVPIVYGNAFEPVVDYEGLPANVTGRRIPLPFAETFALARRLQPGAKRVVLVTGAAAMDSAVLTQAVREMTPMLGSMRLDVLAGWSYQSLLKSLRELPKETFVILASFRRDWQGQAFSSGDLIPSVTRAAAVPVYGIARNWVGDGIVGGTTMQFAAEGARTGALLVRVLRQPAGEQLPEQEVAANPTVVDWRQLERWGLSEKRLPAGTQLLFKPLSVWERYRVAILLMLGVTAVQSVLIGLLVLERRRRVRAQRSLHSQAAYEELLSALRMDAVRHAPDDAPDALDNAVARIGRYSGAASAELLVYGDIADQPPEIYRWSHGRSPVSRDASTDGVAVMEIPLLSDAMLVGSLKLDGVPADLRTRNASRERIESAADVVAAALARAGAARALLESRGHVAHLARVATMSQLGAAVTHELRQPLTAIRANAEAGVMMLRKESPDLHEVREALRDIVNDNTRAMEVIEHVRMLLRSETTATAPVSINDICREAAKLVHRYAETRQVDVDLALADDLPTVRGDAVQLQQVVINLVLNAVESAAASTRERRVAIATVARSTRIELEVSDSGAGLPPQVRHNLFKSFFSTKKNGLGMGLAIVHQIVERHLGQVQAQNGPGGGAVFRVTLPTERGVG
jgi:C4-dicarboxylate-specific signal transduction histidine kinase